MQYPKARRSRRKNRGLDAPDLELPGLDEAVRHTPRGQDAQARGKPSDHPFFFGGFVGGGLDGGGVGEGDGVGFGPFETRMEIS